MTDDDPYRITSIEELRALTGHPSPRPASKVIDHIDDVCRAFIAASPFCVLATVGADGLPDLSPKGDPAGFVHVLDAQTLVLPDRPGNKRHDSFENLFHHPEAALIFLIPGHNDTLRVAGTAAITRHPELLAPLAINGRTPELAIVLKVREAFLHCAKSMVRSSMWKPERLPDTSTVPSLGEAMLAHGDLVAKGHVKDLAEMDEIIERSYKEQMY